MTTGAPTAHRNRACWPRLPPELYKEPHRTHSKSANLLRCPEAVLQAEGYQTVGPGFGLGPRRLLGGQLFGRQDSRWCSVDAGRARACDKNWRVTFGGQAGCVSSFPGARDPLAQRIERGAAVAMYIAARRHLGGAG